MTAKQPLTDEGPSLLDAWADAFNTREPERVAALYAEDALLHGTSLAPLRVGIAQIRSYFRGTSTVEFGERHDVRVADDCLLSAGHYRFSRMQDGQRIVTRARFTFVFQRREGEWKVLHHHSSAEPA